MDCEKCGASMDEGAETCPECGEPIGSAVNDDPLKEEVAPNAPETPTPPVAGDDAPRRSPVMMAVVGAIVVVLLAVGAYFVYGRVSAANSPAAVVAKMMAAYGAYDAAGILDVSTHSTLKPADIKTFETQAADAKKRAGGKPGVKDIVVGKVTSSSATTSTVEVTGQWLADSTKGTYEKRTEKLTVVKTGGKWLVQLF